MRQSMKHLAALLVASLGLTSCIDGNQQADVKADTGASAPKLNCVMAPAGKGTYAGLFYGLTMSKGGGSKPMMYYGRGSCTKAGLVESTRTLDQFTSTLVAYVDGGDTPNFKPTDAIKYTFDMTADDVYLVKGDDRINVGKIIVRQEWAQLVLSSNVSLVNLVVLKDGAYVPFNSQKDHKIKFEDRLIHIAVKR